MGRKNKTHYGLGKLIKDCEMVSGITEPKLKLEMMEQVNMRVRGWRMEMIRKGKWKSASNEIANWCNSICKQQGEHPEIVKFLLNSLFYEEGLTWKHYLKK